MTVDDLIEKLNEIVARLPATQADKVRQHISSSRVRTIGFVPSSADDAGAQAGGKPLLPAYFKWPSDRYGQSMTFIAQFDLARINAAVGSFDLPAEGMLSIFHSAAAAGLTSKDRKAFCINFFDGDRKTLKSTEQPDEIHLAEQYLKSGLTWTISEDLSLLEKQAELSFDVVSQLQNWTKHFNKLSKCSVQLFGSGINDLQQLQQICAFAASGITYNATRAADHHYSHLVDESADWFALARINEHELFGDAHTVQESVLMMRQSDFKERLFDRAWLSVRSRK